ncbi:MAG: type II toxin-antitoxin system VapC family toxin [Blastocatellia bacterium]
MPLYVLDTNHLSLMQRGNKIISNRLLSVVSSEVAITVISWEEQLRGWLAVINKVNNGEQLIKAYQQLKLATLAFSQLNILDYNHQSDQLFDKFRKQKIRIGTQDLRIATIVITNNGILLTRNQKDFSQVPGLQIDDWSK